MLYKLPDRLENCRLLAGPYSSKCGTGANGAFMIIGPCATELRIIANDASTYEALGWEHVSVSCKKRCPNWIEMCFIKDLFWGEEECVVKFHPPKSEYVNHHPFCLHLWKPPFDIPTPPSEFVGPK